MRRGLDPFRAVPLLELEEGIRSVTCTENALYLGTEKGALIHFEVDLVPGAVQADELKSLSKRRSTVRLSRSPVEQVCTSCGFVFALTDGAVNALPCNDLATVVPTVIGRDARFMCVHTGLEQPETLPEVCVAHRKKISLYTHGGKSFEQRQEFPTPDAASALVWHQSWICAGFKKEYNLYSDRAGVPREICSLDGKMQPRIAVVSGSELLLMIQENTGIFFNLCSQQPSPKGTVSWPRKIVAFGASGHYIIGSTGVGQVDVFGVRDQKNCQTLTVTGAVAALCSAAGGRVLVAADSCLTCLDPVPFDRQIKKLLIQARIAEALDLLNATFGPEDIEREVQLSRLHDFAGWGLFRDLQFVQAFQHFLYSAEVKIARILAFWKKYLPSDWDPATFGGKPCVDDGAPEPCDIEVFVRSRLSDGQSTENRNPTASAVSANVGMANAALASFLLRQREAMKEQEFNHGPNDQTRLLQSVDAVLVKLLIEADEDDFRLQQVLDSGVRCAIEDLETFLRERERVDVLASLCKAHGRHDMVLQEWSCMLRGGATGTLGESSGKPGSPKMQRISRERIVSEMVTSLQSACREDGGGELLRKYLPELLAADPTAVLPIFTGQSVVGNMGPCPLPAQEVLDILGGHADLVKGFLEHLVVSTRDASPKYYLQLAQVYLAQISEEVQAGAAMGPVAVESRNKFLKFLEETACVDARALLPRVEELGLLEEKIVLCSLIDQHTQAIQALVEDLNDLPRAESYSRIASEKYNRSGAQEMPRDGFPHAENVGKHVSVFAKELPDFARSVVFSHRVAGEAADAGQPSQVDYVLSAPSRHSKPAVSSARTFGSSGGSFMVFLEVLLKAHSGAEACPRNYPKVAAEYKEAVLALLMGYVGHPDLKPHEVLGVLPDCWPLECLAGYLSKCARESMHGRRASMFEESLSSMAYLKTFSAWAREKKKKVTIDKESCCPTCNRRFVGQDNVAKAFVAYPNETCLHLQCKDDLSVCPKTGQNFKDNMTVYCNALCADAGD